MVACPLCSHALSGCITSFLNVVLNVTTCLISSTYKCAFQNHRDFLAGHDRGHTLSRYVTLH